jgi:pyruvate dehydrogenase E2 component (dihydrolipoamide acetyltransferase)
MATSITAVTMPKWGIEMTEGVITTWRVQPGERVERGKEILDVETDKIVNAVESPASGVLRRIVAGEGETRAVGALIGVIADEQMSDADIAGFIETFVGAVVSFEPTAGGDSEAPAVTAKPIGGTDATTDEARVSPIARRIAERLGVDLSQVTGTGRNGRIATVVGGNEGDARGSPHPDEPTPGDHRPPPTRVEAIHPPFPAGYRGGFRSVDSSQARARRRCRGAGDAQ